ncbi:hypothetical protein V6N13_084065 [Hibiscus sabdariffa]
MVASSMIIPNAIARYHHLSSVKVQWDIMLDGGTDCVTVQSIANLTKQQDLGDSVTIQLGSPFPSRVFSQIKLHHVNDHRMSPSPRPNQVKAVKNIDVEGGSSLTNSSPSAKLTMESCTLRNIKTSSQLADHNSLLIK